MVGSLQDQLLGAGLVNKQKAKNIQTAKKKAVKQSRANNTQMVNEASTLADKARDEQRRKSQSLNDKHKLEVEQKAVQAQIRQMIVLNSIEKLDDKEADRALAYNFTDDKKIKTLYVSSENHDLISRGSIAIAILDNVFKNKEMSGDNYHLIPAVVANKIKERDNSSVVLLNDALVEKAEDDGEELYADYQIPDDLMW